MAEETIQTEEIQEDIPVSNEDLVAALRNELTEPIIEQPPMEPGRDLTKPLDFQEPAPEPVQEPVGEPVEGTVPDPQYLSEEELDTYKVKGKVYGEEVEYSLRDLLNTNQTQDAAADKHNEYKELVNQQQTLIEQLRTQGTQAIPEAEDEFVSDEERKIRNLENELHTLRDSVGSFQTDQLADTEENYMRKTFEKAGLNEDQAKERIATIIQQFPHTKRFARNLFTDNPSSKEDLQDRLDIFETFWGYGNMVEMPRIVKEAQAQGREDATVDKKRRLTTVSGGANQMSDSQSRNEAIEDASRAGKEDDWARLILEQGIIK